MRKSCPQEITGGFAFDAKLRQASTIRLADRDLTPAAAARTCFAPAALRHDPNGSAHRHCRSKSSHANRFFAPMITHEGMTARTIRVALVQCDLNTFVTRGTMRILVIGWQSAAPSRIDDHDAVIRMAGRRMQQFKHNGKKTNAHAKRHRQSTHFVHPHLRSWENIEKSSNYLCFSLQRLCDLE